MQKFSLFGPLIMVLYRDAALTTLKGPWVSLAHSGGQVEQAVEMSRITWFEVVVHI